MFFVASASKQHLNEFEFEFSLVSKSMKTSSCVIHIGTNFLFNKKREKSFTLWWVNKCEVERWLHSHELDQASSIYTSEKKRTRKSRIIGSLKNSF